MYQASTSSKLYWSPPGHHDTQVMHRFYTTNICYNSHHRICWVHGKHALAGVTAMIRRHGPLQNMIYGWAKLRKRQYPTLYHHPLPNPVPRAPYVTSVKDPSHMIGNCRRPLPTVLESCHSSYLSIGNRSWVMSTSGVREGKARVCLIRLAQVCYKGSKRHEL